MDLGQTLALVSTGIVVLTNFALLVRMGVKVQDLLHWQPRVDSHIADTTKHLDPHRDDYRWTEVQRRLDSLERKVDKVLVLESRKRDTDE